MLPEARLFDQIVEAEARETPHVSGRAWAELTSHEQAEAKRQARANLVTAMDQMPELSRLAERFKTVQTLPDGGKQKIIEMHAWWGEDGVFMSPEQKAALINRLIEEDAADAAVTVPIRLSQLREIYQALKQLVELSKINVADIDRESVELRDFRLKVGELVEMPCLHAWQALPPPERAALRAGVQTNSQSEDPASGAVDT